MRYQAVIFDMGDIFFDATIWRRWLAEHLQALGTEIDYPGLCRSWDAKLVDVYMGRRVYWDAFCEFLGELGLRSGDIEHTIAACRQKAAEIENRTLFDGVAETLRQLSQKRVKLAVLSDTESHESRVRQRLADLGIEKRFDAVVTSIDIGHVKPEPAAFAAVLDRLKVEAGASIFVGHDCDELEGAMRCGLTAVAFNYHDDVPANHYIEHFSQLIELVE